MELTRKEYEERIRIAIYRGASYQANRKNEDDIEEEVKLTLNILEKRSLNKGREELL